MELPWVSQVCPKYDHMCPDNSRGKLCIQSRKWYNNEAEIRGMEPQSVGNPQKLKKQEYFLLEPLWGALPANILTFFFSPENICTTLASRTMKEVPVIIIPCEPLLLMFYADLQACITQSAFKNCRIVQRKGFAITNPQMSLAVYTKIILEHVPIRFGWTLCAHSGWV